MDGKILIVEDEYIVASDLRLILESAGYEICGIAPSVERALEIIGMVRPAWVFLDIYLSGKLTGIDLALTLVEMNIPFIYISANSNQRVLESAKMTRPYGFLVKPFREKDVLVTLDVAKYRHDNNLETKLLKEMDLQEEVMKIIAEQSPKEDKVLKILRALQPNLPFDCLSICWNDEGGVFHDGQAFLKTGDDNFKLVNKSDFFTNSGSLAEELKQAKKYLSPVFKAVSFAKHDFITLCRTNTFDKITSKIFDLHSMICKKIQVSGVGIIGFSFYSHDDAAYHQDHQDMLDRLSLMLAKIADCISDLRDLSVRYASPLADAEAVIDVHADIPVVSTGLNIEDEEFGLIGKGPVFAAIKNQVAIAAPVDITVLLLGESGTGKERIAQAIHNLSTRKHKPIIKVNCAAIPVNLIETELFGHEKGAYTGAHERRIGKFEQAMGGTIFLDEIGELPIDMQVKLLCVLQEREITRIGGNTTIKIDVRVIAATNANLEEAIEQGRFRLDLYYRLNVFPVILPPLRERKEDIPELVSHFLKKFSIDMKKPATSVSPQAMRDLISYSWPGNIRELENIIERSIILSDGAIVNNVPLVMSTAETAIAEQVFEIKTIKQMEKEHILSVLKKCKGKVAGIGGAAELLDLPPNTLVAKIKRLGIGKEYS